jgi:ATP-dependent RNA helicase DeaD
MTQSQGESAAGRPPIGVVGGIPQDSPRSDARERQGERPSRDPSPRTLRDGEKRDAGGAAPAGGRANDRDRGGRRRPQSALSEWEPPAEKDDDAPLFRDDDGTKPGLGVQGPPHQRDANAQMDRPRDRNRRRGRSSHDDAGADADTIDIKRPVMPAYHIEDEPTIAVGGRSRSTSEPPSRDQPDDPAFTNVFLNVGRRDGLRTEDVQQLLIEKAGLSDSDVGHIRLRDRITFVGIRREHCERAIKALVGLSIGERTLNAEPARDR